jgi:hypothetical protein
MVEETCRGEAYRLFCELCESAVSRQRTRTVQLPGKQCRAEIYNTLVGYEICVVKTKVLNTVFVPDLATARYLRIFTEIGLLQVEIPYHIVRMAELVPDLEKAYRSLWVIIHFFSDQIFRPKEKKYYVEKVFARLRKDLSQRMVGLGILPEPSSPEKGEGSL